MSDFVSSMAGHPVALLFMAAVLLLFVYFILKQLLRLALICGLVLIGIGGYYYFKAPSEFPVRAEKTVNEMTDKTRGVFEQGKIVLEKSKEVTRKIAEKAEKDRQSLSEE